MVKIFPTFALIQINVNRSKRALDLAHAFAVKVKTDFFLISEPNVKAVQNKSNIYCNKEVSAAIWKVCHNLPVVKTAEGKNFIMTETEEFVLYSVYISPNLDLEDFEVGLQELRMNLRTNSKNIVVAGDFNAKSTTWGGQQNDARGRILSEWIEENNLSLLNDGEKPTLMRSTGVSFIDLPLISEDVNTERVEWGVMDEETLSDHQYIVTRIDGQMNRHVPWIHVETNEQKFLERLRIELSGVVYPPNAETCMKALICAHRYSTKKVRATQWKTPYWWNNTISTTRKSALEIRRKYTRARRDERLVEETKAEYRRIKKELKLQITRAKRTKWEEMCKYLDEDPFGEAYKIVRSQLKMLMPKVDLTVEEKVEMTKELNEEEVVIAVRKLKGGKAPGLDSLAPELVKAAIRAELAFFTAVFGRLLEDNKFPECWTKSKLVLIEKLQRELNATRKLRPICLLSAVAKVYEHIIKERLVREIDDYGGFNKNQYGFRMGRSTINVVK